ncbi:MAG TPA: hypothetical protein PK941_13215 [Paludibacter sp.]|nr:hypothetical protein [Paludibacter sp.]
MPNPIKTAFLEQLTKKYGKPKQLSGSLSLFDIGNGEARIYIRYSKVHGRNQAFYGLRKEDLKQLEGFNSFICFLWNTQSEPVFIPFSEFEDVFNSLTPASDGQFKAQIYQDDGIELYIANAGRFNIESFYGWYNLDNAIDTKKIAILPDFTHSQIQTFIGSIGVIKGYDIWIPSNDRNKLDWSLTEKFVCSKELPSRYGKIEEVVREVDVVWIQRGSSELRAMFEVEHSTPIYSGLLRFNDLYLAERNLKPKFSVVSNDVRRSLFLRQINRPTFKLSGLSDVCNFLEYKDVYSWFNRTRGMAR